jgi:hypothetical protein
MTTREDDPPDSLAAEPEDAPPPSRIEATWATLRTRATAFRCLLAGVGAWIITLAPVVVAPRSGALARALALLALATCVGGSQLIARDPRMARAVGLTAFVALSLASWLLASRFGVLAAVDAFRGVLGMIAWSVYAIAWSHPWSLPDARLRDAPPGDVQGLRPRRQTPQLALAIAGAGTLAGIACIVLAWLVDDPARAIFAQAIGTAAAIALITASAAVASVMGKDERPGQAPRLAIDRRMVRTLLVLALIAGGALALYLLR